MKTIVLVPWKTYSGLINVVLNLNIDNPYLNLTEVYVHMLAEKYRKKLAVKSR